MSCCVAPGALRRFVLLGLLVPAANGQPPGVSYYQRFTEAEAHFWNGRQPSAAPVYRQLLREHPDTPLLWERLAESESRMGNHDAALQAWRRAFALGCVRPADCAYEAARSAARTGAADEARSWLRQALDSAFERRPSIADDDAFRALRDDQEFARLAGLAPQNPPPERTGRWRYDLDFLAGEIRRLHYRWRSQPLPERFARAVAQLREEIPTLEDAAIQVRLQHLLALLGDGHSMLYFFAGPSALPQLPVSLYWFADGLSIVAATPGYERWIGHAVEEIEGMAPGELIERLAPYVSRDNDMFLKAMGPVLMTTPAFLKAAGGASGNGEAVLKLRSRSGEVVSVRMPALPARRPLRMLPPVAGSAAPSRYLSRQGQSFWSERIAGNGILYIQLNQVANARDRSLAAFSQELSQAITAEPPRALVLDVRHNVGGNRELLPPFVRAMVHFRQIAPRAPLYVITSRSTFSAAQVLIAQLESLAAVTFAGEPSGSSPTFIGEDTPVVLPYSRLMGSISTRLHQSSSMDGRHWIAPHIPVPLDSKSYFDNRDPVMEAILALHPTPME